MIKVEVDRTCQGEVNGAHLLLPETNGGIQFSHDTDLGFGSLIEDEQSVSDVRLALQTLFMRE